MVKTLKEILALSQEQKDALLVMAIDRLATEHRVYPSNMRIIDKTTSGNYMHQIVQLKCNIKSSEELFADFAKQASIDIDSLAREDDFKYVVDVFDKAFPLK